MSDASADVSNGNRTVLSRLIGVEPREGRATFVAIAITFLLMASYYVLRPVRDAMASDWSDAEVAFLWNLNFFASAALVALVGIAVARIRLRWVVPMLYGVFAALFIGFFLLTTSVSEREFIDKSFYLLVSIFALFHVSVFWTLMADTFTKAQAKRLFAIIASGTSAGALVGPLVPTLLADRLGVDGLMLIAALGLLSVIPLILWLYHLKSADLGNSGVNADTAALVMGGKWWHGFKALFTNPYLLGIAAFILLYVFIGSFVYFEQKNLLAEFDRATRTQILGTVDFITNIVTFGLAYFVTGRVVTRLGMPVALALMPVLVAVAMLVLAFAPLLIVVLALQVARRGGNYGLTRPAREMLYTHVSQEDRFKSKPVIDIAVYRGGDAVSGSLFAALTDGLGLGLAAVAAVGAAIAAAWAWIAVRLGRAFDRQVAAPSSRDH